MSRPIPDAAAVKPMAEDGIKALDGLIPELSKRPTGAVPFNAAGVAQFVDRFNRPDAWKNVKSWDHAAQRYLALVSLNQARGRLDPGLVKKEQAFSQELRGLLEKLRFPEGYDSPRAFDPGRLP
jgi:hypothetical protein